MINRTKFTLWGNHKNRVCYHCKIPLVLENATTEHIIPKCLLENNFVALSCANCNSRLGGMNGDYLLCQKMLLQGIKPTKRFINRLEKRIADYDNFLRWLKKPERELIIEDFKSLHLSLQGRSIRSSFRFLARLRGEI